MFTPVRRYILVGVIILLALVWLYAYRSQPIERDTLTLKDNTKVSGQIVKQDFGKFVVIERPDRQLQVVTWDQIKDIQLFNAPWYLRIDDAIDEIVRFGFLFGVIAFAIGLWQYGESQKWKRAEFLLQEIRIFEPNQNVVNVRKMLAQDPAQVYLYGREKKADGTVPSPIPVNHKLLLSAITKRSESDTPYTDNERAIQKAFNAYFSFLDHFNNAIDSGLVRQKELKLYLEHWLDIIGNPANQVLKSEVRTKLWDYIEVNGFAGTKSLLQKFGYRCVPQK